MEGRIDNKRLEGLQALRAVAALMVVIFHAASVWREKTGAAGFFGPWDMGWAGVDLFFVLSGFVMVWVTQNRSTVGPRAALGFFWKRLTRIFPTWWVFCACMGLYFWLAYGQAAPPPEEGASARFWLSMALWPQEFLPVLTVGWTLTFEMIFYAFFALLVLFPNRVRLPILIIWGVVILWSWRTNGAPPLWPDSWSGILLSPMCLEFIFGAIVAKVVLWSYPPRPIALGALVGGVVIAFLMTQNETVMSQSGGLAEYIRVWMFGLPAALIILGTARLEVDEPFKLPKILVGLGDASYALYLLHLPLLLSVARSLEWLGGLPPTGLSFAVFMIAGTALCAIASLYVHRYLEQPLLRLFRFPLVKSGRELQS